MRGIAPLFALCALLVAPSPAWACEPLNAYDWAVPAESSCVAFRGPSQQPDSPTLEITNNCDSAITVTPVDCLECDVELVVQPQQTGEYVVNGSIGEKETAMFSIKWAADSESGTISGSVQRQEGAVSNCGDDSACSVATGRRPATGGWLVLLGVAAVLSGRRRSRRSCCS